MEEWAIQLVSVGGCLLKNRASHVNTHLTLIASGLPALLSRRPAGPEVRQLPHR
jgi:hypothetical protein